MNPATIEETLYDIHCDVSYEDPTGFSLAKIYANVESFRSLREAVYGHHEYIIKSKK